MAVLFDRQNLSAQITQHGLAFELLQKFLQEEDPELRHRHQRLHSHPSYAEFVDLVFEHVRLIGLSGKVADREAFRLCDQELDQGGYVSVGANVQDIFGLPLVL